MRKKQKDKRTYQAQVKQSDSRGQDDFHFTAPGGRWVNQLHPLPVKTPMTLQERQFIPDMHS
jgi:hypothetical protein